VAQVVRRPRRVARPAAARGRGAVEARACGRCARRARRGWRRSAAARRRAEPRGCDADAPRRVVARSLPVDGLPSTGSGVTGRGSAGVLFTPNTSVSTTASRRPSSSVFATSSARAAAASWSRTRNSSASTCPTNATASSAEPSRADPAPARSISSHCSARTSARVKRSSEYWSTHTSPSGRPVFSCATSAWASWSAVITCRSTRIVPIRRQEMLRAASTLTLSAAPRGHLNGRASPRRRRRL
jgi:hypothetical protein